MCIQIFYFIFLPISKHLSAMLQILMGNTSKTTAVRLWLHWLFLNKRFPLLNSSNKKKIIYFCFGFHTKLHTHIYIYILILWSPLLGVTRLPARFAPTLVFPRTSLGQEGGVWGSHCLHSNGSGAMSNRWWCTKPADPEARGGNSLMWRDLKAKGQRLRTRSDPSLSLNTIVQKLGGRARGVGGQQKDEACAGAPVGGLWLAPAHHHLATLNTQTGLWQPRRSTLLFPRVFAFWSDSVVDIFSL